MAQTVEVKVWVLVDEIGDYVASHDADALNDLYEEQIRSVSEAEGLRRVQITLTVPLPVPFQVEGSIEEDGEAELCQAR